MLCAFNFSESIFHPIDVDPYQYLSYFKSAKNSTTLKRQFSISSVCWHKCEFNENSNPCSGQRRKNNNFFVRNRLQHGKTISYRGMKYSPNLLITIFFLAVLAGKDAVQRDGDQRLFLKMSQRWKVKDVLQRGQTNNEQYQEFFSEQKNQGRWTQLTLFTVRTRLNITTMTKSVKFQTGTFS